jgi:hypothetical protein
MATSAPCPSCYARSAPAARPISPPDPRLVHIQTDLWLSVPSCAPARCPDLSPSKQGMDAALVNTLVALVNDTIGATPLTRIGQAPKTLLAYRTEMPFTKIKTPRLLMPDGRPALIEFLASGQQFVGFGIHPETRQPYWWPHTTVCFAGGPVRRPRRAASPQRSGRSAPGAANKGEREIPAESRIGRRHCGRLPPPSIVRRISVRTLATSSSSLCASASRQAASTRPSGCHARPATWEGGEEAGESRDRCHWVVSGGSLIVISWVSAGGAGERSRARCGVPR